MKTRTFVVTGILFLAGIGALAAKSADASGLAFIVPLALGPMAVTLLLTCFCHRPLSLALLMTSTVLYAAWFFLVYLDVFYWHLDPQSAIALLFVGIYSLPVMLPLWAVAILKRKPLILNS